MRKLIMYATFGISQLAFANCEFSVINYTDSQVTAQVGFYGKIESTLIVPPQTSKVAKIKSDYKCDTVNDIGLGVSYIMFPNDPNGAGANFSAAGNEINLMGKATGEKTGRPMVSDDGKPIWLSYSVNAVSDDKFEVKLNFVGRPNSKSAGTQ